MMSSEEYQELVEDIRKNGQRESIWTYQGKIVDGRNRYKACEELAIQPKIKEWDGSGSLISFVISLNLHRRHLSSSQKAAISLEVEKMLAEEAKERQRLSEGRGKKGNQKFDYLLQDHGRATEKAAKILGTNRQYVSDAKRISKTAPEILSSVKEGKINIDEAKKLSKLPTETRTQIMDRVNKGESKNVREAIVKTYKEEADRLRQSPFSIPEGKYRTIEIDPPWKMNAEEGKSQVMQYPLMTVEEIKALREYIDKLADDNCHLYLWAINPMLPEAFEVMKALGFEYKTCITWIKSNGFGTGHYYRGQTEHVLFGVRGKLDTLRNNQANYFEAPRSKHSQKPEIFYEIAESMSPGPYIRLFARSQRNKWASWGNEL